MKLIISFATVLLFAMVLHAQNENPCLIVRADDMGSSQASNIACIKAYKNGIVTSVEVMAVGPWFPQAVKLLNENPGLDVGLHLVITSEWDNVKWRPLTYCPGLVDKNGYFFPRMTPDKNYPGQSIAENKWNKAEIEQEFRAQIELALRNIPHISHLSGHMGATDFNGEVAEITIRLAEEYNLTHVDGNLPAYFSRAENPAPSSGKNLADARPVNQILNAGYKGAHGTQKEKTGSFIAMLNTLEKGKTYVFIDHPAVNTEEMQDVYHIGYDDVAVDRQGVLDLFTSERIRQTLAEKRIELVSYNAVTKALPRSTPEAEGFSPAAFTGYLKAVKESGQEMHSVMVLRHGKVVAEKWFEGHGPAVPHVMHSVSKTFTATAIGFAVTEKRLTVSDKVVSFFPDDLPAEISPYLADLEIRDLLTMSVGHEKDPSDAIRKGAGSWEKLFLATPIKFEPGTKFVYNSLATYMLSAIVQKVTGEKVIDYLYPRLFRPLGITGAEWETSPSGVNNGGWGLHIKTEDMAKMGQFFLQKGNWQGKQLLPESWFEEATTAHITQPPVWFPKKGNPKESDWVQGYCYQMWRCRNNAYRADGAVGQFIIVIPEKDAVVVTTANLNDMQKEINLIWKHILPAFK